VVLSRTHILGALLVPVLTFAAACDDDETTATTDAAQPAETPNDDAAWQLVDKALADRAADPPPPTTTAPPTTTTTQPPTTTTVAPTPLPEPWCPTEDSLSELFGYRGVYADPEGGAGTEVVKVCSYGVGPNEVTRTGSFELAFSIADEAFTDQRWSELTRTFGNCGDTDRCTSAQAGHWAVEYNNFTIIDQATLVAWQDAPAPGDPLASVVYAAKRNGPRYCSVTLYGDAGAGMPVAELQDAARGVASSACGVG
jgi:hypothetical protein